MVRSFGLAFATLAVIFGTAPALAQQAPTLSAPSLETTLPVPKTPTVVLPAQPVTATPVARPAK